MLTFRHITYKKLNKALIILYSEKKRYFKSGMVCIAHEKMAYHFWLGKNPFFL